MKEKNKYKVLARKYRPQKFKDLIGQDMLVDILSNAIINNRLAHAYILTGVRGVGKTTTARLIAMSINCNQREKNGYEPCGSCDSCHSTGVDNNLDVIEMDAASNTGVDDIREIIDNVKYKPVTSTYKIFIIDEVHMLSKSAFNALLKTLEEPPDHVKFIFATTEVKKIPITVLSRCQRFDLHRIDNNKLSDHLMKIAKYENILIDSDAIALIVRAADGSIRDGLSLLDQAITDEKSKIDSNAIIQMLGLANKEEIFNLLEQVLNGKSFEALQIYRNLYDLGADVNMIFDEMLNVVHFLTQIKLSPNMKDDIYIPESERVKGSKLASNLSLNNLNIIWQILFKGFQELESGIHLYQHGEMIILRIIHLYDSNNPDDLLKKIKNSDEKNSDNSNNQTNKKFEDSDKILNFNEVNKNDYNIDINKQNHLSISDFRQFVEMFFRNKEAILHAKLYNEVTLISFKDGEVVINNNKITDKSFNRNVAKLISKWTGRIWKIENSNSNIGKSLHDEDIINQQKEIELMKNNKDIKRVLKEYPDSIIHSISDLGEINNKDETKNIAIKKEK